VDHRQIQVQSQETFREVQVLRTQSDAILQLVSTTPRVVTKLGDLVKSNIQQQTQQADLVKQGLASVIHQMQSLALSSKSTLDMVRARGSQAGQAIMRMSCILRDIWVLVQR
jgi:hypothetical protein